MNTAHIVLQLKSGDEVGVALRDIHAGEALAPFAGSATVDIPFGCQRQSKSEPMGNAKCCHFRVCKIAA